MRAFIICAIMSCFALDSLQAGAGSSRPSDSTHGWQEDFKDFTYENPLYEAPANPSTTAAVEDGDGEGDGKDHPAFSIGECHVEEVVEASHAAEDNSLTRLIAARDTWRETVYIRLSKAGSPGGRKPSPEQSIDVTLNGGEDPECWKWPLHVLSDVERPRESSPQESEDFYRALLSGFKENMFLCANRPSKSQTDSPRGVFITRRYQGISGDRVAGGFTVLHYLKASHNTEPSATGEVLTFVCACAYNVPTNHLLKDSIEVTFPYHEHYPKYFDLQEPPAHLRINVTYDPTKRSEGIKFDVAVNSLIVSGFPAPGSSDV